MCAYFACIQPAIPGGLCVGHTAYVHGATTTLDAERMDDQ